MLTSSKKNKGHRLESLVRTKLIEAFDLDPEDIRIPVSSENGPDIILNHRAKVKCPYVFECKYHETFTSIYRYYDQAKSHNGGLVPLLILKMNRKEPLVVLDFDQFLTLVSR